MSADVTDAGSLPRTLWGVDKEWYELCERAPHATKIAISGELAEAIVATVVQSADAVRDGSAMVPALEVFRIAGGDVECQPEPTADAALNCLRDLRKCYDEALSGSASGHWQH